MGSCDIMLKNMINRIVGENRGTRNERFEIAHMADPIGYLRGSAFGRLYLAGNLASPAVWPGCLGCAGWYFRGHRLRCGWDACELESHGTDEQRKE